jgi:hypothetical protein
MCSYCSEFRELKVTARRPALPGSDLARWPRMRDLIPRMRDLTAAAAIATVILVTMGAYTAAAILIVILSVVAVIRR